MEKGQLLPEYLIKNTIVWFVSPEFLDWTEFVENNLNGVVK